MTLDENKNKEPWRADCFHPDFPWKDANEVTDIMYWWTRHIGRFGGLEKWKFGRYRFDVSFSDGTLHSLLKPGYCYYRWPRWIWYIDYYIIRSFVVYSKLITLIRKWQKFIYILAYKKVVTKFPYLRDEILADADQYEWLEGIAGFKHADHWITLDDINKEKAAAFYDCRTFWDNEVCKWADIEQLRKENSEHPLVKLNDMFRKSQTGGL